jgi:hypothetical protein
MGEQIPAGARTIRCEQCGAAIELVDLRPAVTCRYCGRSQPVDEAVLERLEHYRDQVGFQLSSAEQERKNAARWEYHTRRMKGSGYVKQTVVAMAIAMGAPAVVIGAFMLLKHQGVIGNEQMMYLGPVCTGVTLLGLMGYFVWYYTGAKRKGTQTSMEADTVACPQCGAANEMLPGQVVDTCEHCGAALFPDEEARRRGVEAAADEHRRARMERYRAERSGMATYGRLGMGSNVVMLVVAGSFLVPLGLGAVGFTVAMMVGAEPYSPAIFLLWGALVLLLAGVTAYVLWTKRLKQRIRLGLEQLVERHQGQILGGLQGTVSWLNRYWAGPFDLKALVRGPYNDSAWFALEGYPVLVDLDLKAASQHHEPRAWILLAAEIPAVSAGHDATLQLTAGVRTAINAIADEGFEADFQQGGLIAKADRATIRSLLRSPETIPPLFDEVATHMTTLAHHLSASPVPPLPG